MKFQIVGRPTKFPSYGDFSQTFVMRDYGPWWLDCPSGRVFRTPCSSPKPAQARGSNFIDLKFEHAVFPFRINIYETYNPGGVAAIWAGDCQGRWRQLWDRETGSGQVPVQPSAPRQFSPPVAATEFPSRQIRLEFDTSQLAYYTEIDAVCLLGTLEPCSPAARAAALLPAPPLSPLLFQLVARRLHVLPSPTAILRACAEQLEPRALARFVREQAERETGTGRTAGCWDLLPRELVLAIFSYLDLASLVRTAQVCSAFHQLARDPSLYRMVDLRQVFHCVSSSSLAWLTPLATRLTSLDLSWCGNYGSVSPASLAALVMRVAGQLERLVLDNCHVATGEVLTAVGTCTALTSLSLSNCHLLRPQDFQALCGLQELQSLNLYRTAVQQSCVLSLLCSNRGLACLSLAACSNLLGDEVCLVLAHCQAASLISLDLWRCSSLTARGVTALAACTRLTDLDLGWCLNVGAGLISLTENCPDLRRVFLTAHRQTGDRDLAALAALPRLAQLDILGNRNVSLGAVTDLLARAPNLALLDISFCHQLGEASIAQLISQYPEVSIKWSFTDAVS